ncbi:NAD(P)/FAD-dependent oxidoreductase [Nocardia sp. X0981]
MPGIVVVGGGFAGVWSAAGAVRAARAAGRDLPVTLIAPGDDLVIRPRLYQAEPDRMRVCLDSILGPVGVRRIAGTATTIDTTHRTVTVVERDGVVREIDWERLVLATGSRLVRPELPGAELLHDVDTLPAAAALDAHLRRLAELPPGAGRYTAVVVGAGFTGLEIATELVDRLRAAGPAPDEQVRVVLVERAETIGPELGPGPRPQITAALAALGVEQRLGTSLVAVEPGRVTLTDGTSPAAHTVVWTAGVRASALTADIPAARDHLGRLEVDADLQVTGVPGVYAAGDTAAAAAGPDRTVLQCCQHALQLGKFAGHNAAAGLLGHPAAPFTAAPYVTCLDLGSTGAVFTNGWDRRVVATGAIAKARKRTVNEVWIYPPTDDPEELLRQADYRFSVREIPAPGTV